MSSDSSCQTKKASRFASYLIDEAMRLSREGLTPTNLEEWILYKWYDWAEKTKYPKPWPFNLKPLLFGMYNSSHTTKTGENNG